MLNYISMYAGMSELADETDSKSVIREGVWVQVPLPALFYQKARRREDRLRALLYCFLQISPTRDQA